MEKQEMTAWADRLSAAKPALDMKYEDLRDSYVYLRSTKKLLRGDCSALHANIKEEIERLFKDKFGSVIWLRAVVNNLEGVGLGPNVSYADRKRKLHVEKIWRKETNREKIAKRYLKQGGKNARARAWQYRIEVAIEQAVDAHWYPLWGTYTVDPQRLPKGCLTRDQLWTQTPAWDKLVKRFKTETADACGYGRKPSKWPKGKEFFQYFAVIEHGKSGDHPHVHVIWLCKQIPKHWKTDPNDNCPTNTEVDICAASALWPHGTQRKTKALFITGSWFAEHWVLPRKSIEEPGKKGTAAAVAGYVGKYITKSETKKWTHRVKCTSNLGIQRLQKLLRGVKTLTQLETLATRPTRYNTSMLLQQATRCPMSLLRQKSKTELWRRLHSLQNTQAKTTLKELWTKKPNGFYTRFIESVKLGRQIWREPQGARYRHFSQISEEIKSTAHSEQNLQTAIAWLCYNEPRRKTPQQYTPLKGEHAL